MAIDQSQREDSYAGSAKWLLARKFIGLEKFELHQFFLT